MKQRLVGLFLLLALAATLLLPLNIAEAGIEEQTQSSSTDSLNRDEMERSGQRLTITNRTVSKLAFLLHKYGNPTGNITFTIRNVTDDSIINSKFWGNASMLATTATWEEVTFDTPILINEEVRILVEFDEVWSGIQDDVRVSWMEGDVKGGEEGTNYDGSWHDDPGGYGWDCAYRYTYLTNATITTNNATYVTRTTARLNSYLSDDGGEACDVRFQYDTTSGGGGTVNMSENQTTCPLTNKLYSGLWEWAGQRLNITGRNVTALSFPLMKVGSPTGDVNFTIRYDGNNTLINSVTWGDASALNTTKQWESASFTSPVVVNATVHILVEYYGGDASNYIQYHHEDSDVKANENFAHYDGAAWTNLSTYDGGYNYTYLSTSGYTYNTSWVNDTYTTGDSPYADITSLTTNTTYYFRVQVRNTMGTTNGSELNFTTYPVIYEPTNLTAYPDATTISLTWTKGVNAAYTMIRGQVGAYPANYTDGEQVYAGPMSTALHSGLSPGTTYYYRARSYDNAGYSANYTDILMTTSAYTNVTQETPAAPTTPSNWWGTPDYTNLQNIAGYGIINTVADNFEIPRNTFWMSLILILIMSIGLFIYSVQHNVTVALVLMGIMIVTASIAGLLPLWLIAAIGIPVAGIMMVKRRV